MTPMVLVGMSIAEADRRTALVHEAAARAATVAFLQQADPSLSCELTRLADAGATTIALVGVRLGPDGPAVSWLHRIAAYWWRERTGNRPDIVVATRLARTWDAVDEVRCATKAITGTEPGLTSSAWESVTQHRHQTMICRGPRCTAKGADETARAMRLAMTEQNLGDDDALLIHTGCQFPCNKAPVVSVQPDDVWYGHVDPAIAAAIVSEHFVSGRPLEAHRLPR